MNSIEVRIDSIGAGGDGVGRHDGRVVFVPRTAPGDVVRVATQPGDRFLRGRILDVLSPSDDRVQPGCRHYIDDRCGGCQLQHIAYVAQCDAKRTIIRDALSRIGKTPVDGVDIVPSDVAWRYRRKLTLALRRSGGDWIAGLRRYDDPDSVFPLEDCPITDARVVAWWRAVLSQRALFPDARELRGAVRALSSGFAFTLEGANQWTTAAAFASAVPDLEELWWRPAGKGRRRLYPRAAAAQAGASFTQINPEVAEKVRKWVVARAAVHEPKRVIDAYAGTGDTAVMLADIGATVIAIELDRDAARVAAHRLKAPSRSIAARVEDALPGYLPADLVILNPPRAGVDQRVTVALENAPVRPRLLYISCDPATLARDVRRLPGYRVVSIRGFDMFPQTAHVETVCELSPAA